MLYSDLPPQSKAPILLDKKHHLTTLIVLDAHRRVIHGGVKETLTELRSAFWLVRGRQFVRKLIHRCLICRKYEGRPYQDLPPPPLPEFRVSQSRPFTNTGVDFAGPMYVRPSTGSTGPKVWLCLYTCCVTRAVHLDLVPDLSAITFIRSFKRFTARRGIPAKVVSDNGKTFKSAANIVQRVLNDPAVKTHFADLQVKWSFNLERAPWWGGMFERLIRSAKRCLKKTVGRACLTYDELLTIATDVEGVLNSRPLTYVSTDDQEEPLTPSHLMMGYRVMSLPDVSFQDDPNYNETPDNLNRRMKHLIRTSKKFWSRWRREYLSELREAHRSCRRNKGVKEPVKEGAVVIVYEQGSPRGLWRIGRIEGVIKGHDGGARAAHVRVQSRSGRPIILKRPIQHLYPLEIASAGKSEAQGEGSNPSDDPESAVEDHSEELCESRPQRAAAIAARDRILCYNID